MTADNLFADEGCIELKESKRLYDVKADQTVRVDGLVSSTETSVDHLVTTVLNPRGSADVNRSRSYEWPAALVGGRLVPDEPDDVGFLGSRERT